MTSHDHDIIPFHPHLGLSRCSPRSPIGSESIPANQGLSLQHRNGYLNLSKSTGPAVESLPAEILLHIFVWSVAWTEDDWRSNTNIDQRPITLSHVCSRWRRIVLESSTLWTCLPFHRSSAVLQALMQRSGIQPVDIVHILKPGARDEFDPCVEKALRCTSDRWRSVLWESSEQKMLDMLYTLSTSSVHIPHLKTLELGLQKRSFPGLPLHRLMDNLNPTDSNNNSFQFLEHICLSFLSVIELPSVPFPRLHSLTLHWPVQYPTTRPTLFRMSSLLAFLQRTPRLEALTFIKSSPLMDVLLRQTEISNDPRQLSAIGGIFVSPLPMPKMLCIEWSYAPPRDLWRLFVYLNPSNLRYLELHLDAVDQRWYSLYDEQIRPLGSVEGLPTVARDRLITFAHLEELSLYSSDADGLSFAVRRMAFPGLRRLTLAFMPRRAARLPKLPGRRMSSCSLGVLPALHSIFYEPRLTTLTHLILSDFILEPCSVTMDMLAYMQSLEQLTMERCRGAGAVICALAGAPCGSALDVIRSWTCPNLRHLCITDCEDVKLSCLKETVFVRKAYAEGQVKDKRSLRPIKALRKSRTPKKPLATGSKRDSNTGSDSSKLGSTVPLQPLERIRTVVVEGVSISKSELASLHSDYGVDEVQWSA